MLNPLRYYETHLIRYQSEANQLYKKMTAFSIYRLVVFLLTALGIFFLFHIWQLAVFIGIIGVILFLVLLSKHTNLKGKYNIKKALVTINQEEIAVALGDFHDRDTGLLFQDTNHFYSLDIDVFGHGSFFQFINRTTLNEGTKKLADILKSNCISSIFKRQQAIKELSNKPDWRQFFSATSHLVSVDTSEKHIINWLKHYTPFLPTFMRWLPAVFILITGLLFGLIVLSFADVTLIGYWLFIGLGITGMYLKKINALAANTHMVRDTFRQYASLLDLIERETFTCELLLKKQKKIESKNKRASSIFKELSKSLDALDNRNNLIGAIFGNGYFLTDLKHSFYIEQWIKRYADKVEDWFEVVSFFDAYNTLGNFTFNHPDFVFPEIVSNKTIIKASHLGHPMLPKSKRVTSHVNINSTEFFIVTGANMAGKSTFLRTISLHIVMANIGLPVCASASQYNPVKLITSMRTTDSLTDDSSYFFSELTRLKYIIDTITQDTYFIVLDEILKGTNSIDKAIGSRKFVEKLVASKATGIIATHDLSLCDIEKDIQQVKNYFFDAEIKNDTLHFDYKLKPGICKNMNASFLLKKMKII